MLTDPRILLTALPALALAACFDPALDLGDGDGSATGASSTTDPAGSTTDRDTAGSGADSTGPTDTDAPPVITAFTVDSSTTPQEQQTAGMVAFDVDAMDDVGIDRIEIYDGEELVATTYEIPYVTKILLTSADNGTHLYSAIAYDTAGQTAESEVVSLSVNIVGGAMLELRQDIADVRMSYVISSVPRIAIDPSDNVTIVTSFREDAPVEARNFGIMALMYTDTLSLLWTDNRLPSDFGPYITFMNVGRPSYDAVSSSWWTGGAKLGEVEQDRAVAIIDSGAEQITTFDSTGDAIDYYSSPVATDSESAIVLSPALGQLEKRSALDATPTWTVPIGGENAFFTDILVAADDSIVLVLREEDCSPSSDWCIYKLSPSGDVLWSRPVPSSTPGSTVNATLSPLGHVAVARSSQGAAQLIVFDANGATLTDQLLTDDAIYEPIDIRYDAQGAVVLAGELRLDSGDYEREAWAGRFDEQGNPIWFQIYDFDADHGVTGVATNAAGKLFVVGWEDSFEPDIVGWSGRGWVAEVAL